jgi:hypothetical protein
VVNNVIAHGVITTESVKLDIATFPPMEDDIQALSQFSRNAKIAGIRLIERGDEILTVAHGVLADANAPYPQRLQLLYVLGEIGNPDSATEIIHAIEDFPNNRYLYQNALLALSNYEPTEEINTFVNRQLDITKRDPLIQRSALNYYAKQPHDDAEQWIEKYALNSNANPEVRYTALYMAGMNGVEAVKQPIKEVLDTTTNTTREYFLLLGFVNVASMEEFDALVKDKKLNLDNVKRARDFLTFRLANSEEKKIIAPEALSSNNSQLKRIAVDHFIEVKDADALAANWNQSDTYVRSALKRSGYELEMGDDGAKFAERQHKHDELSMWWFGLVLAGFLVVGILWQRRRAS